MKGTMAFMRDLVVQSAAARALSASRVRYWCCGTSRCWRSCSATSRSSHVPRISRRAICSTPRRRYAAEAGLNLAVYELRKGRSADRWIGDGGLIRSTTATPRSSQIADESGKIDLRFGLRQRHAERRNASGAGRGGDGTRYHDQPVHLARRPAAGTRQVSGRGHLRTGATELTWRNQQRCRDHRRLRPKACPPQSDEHAVSRPSPNCSRCSA